MTTVSIVKASVRVQLGDGAPRASVTAYVPRDPPRNGDYADWYEWLVMPSVALSIADWTEREQLGSHHIDRWAEGVDYGALRAQLGAPGRIGTLCRSPEPEAEQTSERWPDESWS